MIAQKQSIKLRAKDDFSTYRAIRYEAFIAKDILNLVTRYVLRYCQQKSELKLSKQVADHALDWYNPIIAEAMLFEYTEVLESIVGIQLEPTYSFLRLYSRGAELLRHTDRPACEYSATACIALHGANDWPLHLQGP